MYDMGLYNKFTSTFDVDSDASVFTCVFDFMNHIQLALPIFDRDGPLINGLGTEMAEVINMYENFALGFPDFEESNEYVAGLVELLTLVLK